MWGTELDPDRGPLWVREQWGKGQRVPEAEVTYVKCFPWGLLILSQIFFVTAKVNIS